MVNNSKHWGLFKRNRHIFGGLGRGPEKSRLSSAFFLLRWRPGGGGPANTRSSYKRYRRKKKRISSHPDALLVASSSTGFIINEPKQVLSLSILLPNRSTFQEGGNGERESLIRTREKKRKKRLTDVTKHASI